MVPLDQLLSNVAVIGAAGKMGSGIALVLLQEMTRLSIAGKGHYTLHLIDTNQSALEGLEDYLRTQMVKFAERNHGGDNTYVARAMEILKTEVKLDKAKEAHLVFEAIIEDVDIKAKVLKEIKNPQAYYFSNTSSIPIQVLNEKAQLDHRLIGCHFYNPPAIQRLVEVIPDEKGDPKLTDLTLELANRMHKVVVESRDVAGFIGNGQFVREILYANQLSQQLSAEIPLTTVVASLNRVTQEFLIRPMGIYQLMDYVGIDVAKKILAIMRTYLKDNAFHDELVEKMIQAGVLGGQHPDGSQKDGFFQYEKGRIKGIYSLEHNHYIDIPKTDWLGDVPHGHYLWKDLVKDPDKDTKLKTYLTNLFAANTRGAALAQAYLINSKQIARKLVEDKVAKDLKDVDKVMECGFYHLYGPGSDLIKV